MCLLYYFKFKNLSIYIYVFQIFNSYIFNKKNKSYKYKKVFKILFIIINQKSQLNLLLGT